MYTQFSKLPVSHGCNCVLGLQYLFNFPFRLVSGCVICVMQSVHCFIYSVLQFGVNNLLLALIFPYKSWKVFSFYVCTFSYLPLQLFSFIFTYKYLVFALLWTIVCCLHCSTVFKMSFIFVMRAFFMKISPVISTYIQSLFLSHISRRLWKRVNVGDVINQDRKETDGST